MSEASLKNTQTEGKPKQLTPALVEQQLGVKIDPVPPIGPKVRTEFSPIVDKTVSDIPPTPHESLPRPPEIGPKVWKPELETLPPTQMKEEVAAGKTTVNTQKSEPSGGPINYLINMFKGGSK